MRKPLAPTPIAPPVGDDLRVYVFDPAAGTVELVESCGDDGARASKVMRKTEGSTCYARGAVVCSFKSTTPPSHHARMKAAVAAWWAARPTLRREPRAAEVTRALTPADVEPAAPSGTTDPDEEPMTEKTNCGKCHRHPVAGVTKTTPEGTETWCAHCRRIESARRRGSSVGGDHRSASSKKVPRKSAARTPAAPARTAPAPAAPADPMAPLREALDALVSGGVSEVRVREIVREELRALLTRPA